MGASLGVSAPPICPRKGATLPTLPPADPAPCRPCRCPFLSWPVCPPAMDLGRASGLSLYLPDTQAMRGSLCRMGSTLAPSAHQGQGCHFWMVMWPQLRARRWAPTPTLTACPRTKPLPLGARVGGPQHRGGVSPPVPLLPHPAPWDPHLRLHPPQGAHPTHTFSRPPAGCARAPLPPRAIREGGRAADTESRAAGAPETGPTEHVPRKPWGSDTASLIYPLTHALTGFPRLGSS